MPRVDLGSPAPLRFPTPLRPGDVVGVTSPSSGASGPLQARLDVAIEKVAAAGYRVEVGACMDGSGHVSAPAPQRAAELQRMLCDPAIRAVVPPWGGETAIDLIPHFDWAAIAAAEPTWVFGFSDIATLITPLTLACGWATVHGNNLMDTPYDAPPGLLTWLDIVALPRGASFTQRSPRRFRRGFVDYVEHPKVSRFDLDAPGGWRRLDVAVPAAGRSAGSSWAGPNSTTAADAPALDVSGRLIGGCIETLCNLAGTRYLDTAGLRAGYDNGVSGGGGSQGASDSGRLENGRSDGESRSGDGCSSDHNGEPAGLIVYVEAAGDDAATICRNLHGMRLNGFFDAASAVLVGRTAAPDSPTLTQDEAVLDALRCLGVPLLADVECGHVAPYLPLVNGAFARVVHDGSRAEFTQTLA